MIVRDPDHHALAGIRVVDFGQYVAGPLAAMILADNGADVVRVDPPDGPRWDHVANAMLQRGKKSIVLDLKRDHDRAVARDLVDRSDVLIEGFRPGVMERLGLGPRDVRARNPRLVYASLPGFAHDDHRRNARAWESIVAAAAGMHSRGPQLRGNGRVDLETDDAPELLALPTASVMAAVNAVNATVAALIARERDGRGQIVEAPLFDAAFEVLNFEGQSPRGPSPMRLGPIVDGACADGRWVQVLLTTPRHLRRFAAAFLTADDALAGLADPALVIGDPAMTDRLRARVRGVLATAPAAVWDERINAAGVPASVLLSAAEWMGEEQARAIRAAIEVEDPVLGPTTQPGYAFALSTTPPRVRSGRHRLDADRAEVLELASTPRPPPAADGVDLDRRPPLDGVLVIDASVVLAGPTAGRVLAAFGADVVKVNQPGYWIGFWLHANAGKRSALVDLQTPGGRDILNALVADADVFISNLAEDAVGRLGIDEPSIRRTAPDIVYLSLSAYGADGPRRSFRGFEHVAQTRTGITFRRGAGRPVPIRFPLSDCGAGHFGAMGVLLALFYRALRGGGQAVTTSLVQAATYHQAPLLVRPRRAQVKGSAATPLDDARLHRCADGRWICVVGPEGPYLDVVRAVSRDRHDDLATALVHQGSGVWLDAFRVAGLAGHLVEHVPSAFGSATTRTRGVVAEHVHTAYGRVVTVGATVRLSATPLRLLEPPEPPGSATRHVLRDLGRGADAETLLEVGAIADDLAADGLLSW